MKKYTTQGLVLFLAGIFIFSGCIGTDLKRKYPDIKTYALEAPRPEIDIAFSGEPAITRINRFSAASIVQDAFFDYRVDEARYEADFYNQTVVPPAEMVTTQLREWMKASPLVEFVLVNKDAGVKPVYVITGTLLDLYGDYRDTQEPKAVLTLECLISLFDAGTTKLLLQKTYTQSVRINRTSPKLLVEGWNRGLKVILQKIEDDLAKVVQENSKKNSNQTALDE